MKYYQGNHPGIDVPIYGGSYVEEHNDAAEVYNFWPEYIEGKNTCLGYVSTKRNNGEDRNQLHIERINKQYVNEPMISDVLVIWCAKQFDNRTVVVGWYEQAEVYRNYQDAIFGEYRYLFNVRAKSQNCLLLPEAIRNKAIWTVPRKKKKGPPYGFGSANVWYASEDEAKPFVDKLINNIYGYTGDNWICRIKDFHPHL